LAGEFLTLKFPVALSDSDSIGRIVLQTVEKFNLDTFRYLATPSVNCRKYSMLLLDCCFVFLFILSLLSFHVLFRLVAFYIAR